MGHDSKKSKTNKHDHGESEPRQPLGTYLQKERLKKEFTLEQIAEETCIHISTLRAIEENDRSKMPAEVFTRGFIKLYSDFLGLDKQDVIERYDSERLHLHDMPDPNHDLFHREDFGQTNSLISLRNLFVLSFILALLLAFFFWFFSPEQKKVSTNSLPLQTVETPKDQESVKSSIESFGQKDKSAAFAEENQSAALFTETENSSGKDQGINHQVSENGAVKVAVHFLERSWIQVAIDDNEAIDFLFDPDEVKTWQASEKIQLLIGNSAGVRLTVNDEEFQINGTPGSSLRLTFPDDLTRH